jgi:hypothetical protein
MVAERGRPIYRTHGSSPDDEHVTARNMYRDVIKVINILQNKDILSQFGFYWGYTEMHRQSNIKKCVVKEGSVGLWEKLISITFDPLAERQVRILKPLSLENFCLA